MKTEVGIKEKLGLDIFKPAEEFHITIKSGMAKDHRLRRALTACPAGLYSESANGEISVSADGCLECGTCLILCGADVLAWNYPKGGHGVQFRLG